MEDMVDVNDGRIGIKLAPYNPTNIDAIEIALDLLGIPHLVLEISLDKESNLYRENKDLRAIQSLIYSKISSNEESDCFGNESVGMPVATETEHTCRVDNIDTEEPLDSKSDEMAVFQSIKNQKEIVLYDLGCGDARLLVQACTRYQHDNIRCFGIEYDAEIVKRALANVEKNQLGDKVLRDSLYRMLYDVSNVSTFQICILHENVLNIDFSSATAIFIYLFPSAMKLLKDRLIELIARGIPVVTYGNCHQTFDFKTFCNFVTFLCLVFKIPDVPYTKVS